MKKLLVLLMLSAPAFAVMSADEARQAVAVRYSYAHLMHEVDVEIKKEVANGLTFASVPTSEYSDKVINRVIRTLENLGYTDVKVEHLRRMGNCLWFEWGTK